MPDLITIQLTDLQPPEYCMHGDSWFQHLHMLLGPVVGLRGAETLRHQVLWLFLQKSHDGTTRSEDTRPPIVQDIQPRTVSPARASQPGCSHP